MIFKTGTIYELEQIDLNTLSKDELNELKQEWIPWLMFTTPMGSKLADGRSTRRVIAEQSKRINQALRA